MEFNARYTLIGLFTLAVIGAMFVFVYWLNTIGGLQQRDFYKIQFASPVLGLSRGSRVLFNGLHIGEVSDIELDFNEPDKLFATISIKKDFPLRQDTYVGLDYQSLTGGAAVLLTGRSTNAALLKPTAEKMPLLIADPLAGMSWTQSARAVLNQIHEVLNDNSKPLKDSLENIKTFTGILSQNSERINNIIGGLERFAGGVKDKSKDVIYELDAATRFPSPFVKKDWNLVIAEPTVQLAFNTDKVMIRTADGQTKLFSDGRWSDNLPNLVQAKILQSFENAGLGDVASKAAFGSDGGYQLKLDVRRFHLSLDKDKQADVQYFAKIVDPDGKVIHSRLISATAPVTETESLPAVTKGLSQAFQASVNELMGWIFASL